MYIRGRVNPKYFSLGLKQRITLCPCEEEVINVVIIIIFSQVEKGYESTWGFDIRLVMVKLNTKPGMYHKNLS